MVCLFIWYFQMDDRIFDLLIGKGVRLIWSGIRHLSFISNSLGDLSRSQRIRTPEDNNNNYNNKN